MAKIFIGNCMGIRIYKDNDLRKDEFYLVCSSDMITGILNNSEKHATLHTCKKVIGLASGKGKN